MRKIYDNAPCICALMIGVAALIAAQTMTHTAPQIIETVLGAGLIGIAAYYWGRV